MPLIESTSTVADQVLKEMYAEHLDGIRSFAELLDAPPHPVTDPARIDLARSFAQDVLATLKAAETRSDRAGLVQRVNLSYEAMLILIDYLKTYTSGPKVPRGRAAPRRGK